MCVLCVCVVCNIQPRCTSPTRPIASGAPPLLPHLTAHTHNYTQDALTTYILSSYYPPTASHCLLTAHSLPPQCRIMPIH